MLMFYIYIHKNNFWQFNYTWICVRVSQFSKNELCVKKSKSDPLPRRKLPPLRLILQPLHSALLPSPFPNPHNHPLCCCILTSVQFWILSVCGRRVGAAYKVSAISPNFFWHVCYSGVFMRVAKVSSLHQFFRSAIFSPPPLSSPPPSLPLLTLLTLSVRLYMLY